MHNIIMPQVLFILFSYKYFYPLSHRRGDWYCVSLVAAVALAVGYIGGGE